MRVALVHYWLLKWRGGERVLKAIAGLFPGADIYTHVADLELAKRELAGHEVRTTFIARLPFASRQYQRYLPLMPLALESLDLQRYDLVISSESGPAKGVIVAPHAMHICYCHSPMRYVWDRYFDYRSGTGPITQALMAPLLHYVRLWDQLSAQRVDRFVANSRFVAQRIAKYYGRSSEVIHPPVAVDQFDWSRPAEDFYLHVGELVRYKRPDLVVQAFNSTGRPLIVIGGGEMLRELQRTAKPNVRLLGRQPFEVIRDHYARCRALVFAGVEDFGIVPVEAMASGRPVIALGRGGVLDSVVDGLTGVLFEDQSADALAEAVRRFEGLSFEARSIRAHAERFSEGAFRERFSEFVSRALRQGQVTENPGDTGRDEVLGGGRRAIYHAGLPRDFDPRKGR